MNNNLKPCPFCGASARVEEKRFGSTNLTFWNISCDHDEDCFLADELMGDFISPDDVVAAWNHRAYEEEKKT